MMMDIFEMNYYLWYNLAPIIIMLLFLFLGYSFWKISIQNEEIRIERERVILEKERQKESMQQALQMYERETNRFNETDRKLQQIINRIERENMELNMRTKRCLNDMEDERKALRQQIQYGFQPQNRRESRSRKNDDDKTFEMFCEGVKVVGAIATMFFVGKAAFK